MARRIAIIQGHPDAAGHHLLHVLADAYAEGAIRAGHELRRVEVAKLEFSLLRTQQEFESGPPPPALTGPQDDMRWAEHWVFVFPVWHGTMPALLKGFLEHIFRPGFAMDYAKNAAGDRDASRFPKRLLVGRSARIVVTMGMPVLFYRWYFGAYGIRSFERSMLRFAGIKPIRESFMASPLLTIRNALAGSRTCVGTANAENKRADNVSATILEPSLSGVD